MTIADVMTIAESLGIELRTDGGAIYFRPVEAVTVPLKAGLKRHKPELCKILAGETVADVDTCPNCNVDLIGLPTFDGYINRTCLVCGKWYRCQRLESKQTINAYPDQ